MDFHWFNVFNWHFHLWTPTEFVSMMWRFFGKIIMVKWCTLAKTHSRLLYDMFWYTHATCDKRRLRLYYKLTSFTCPASSHSSAVAVSFLRSMHNTHSAAQHTHTAYTFEFDSSLESLYVRHIYELFMRVLQHCEWGENRIVCFFFLFVDFVVFYWNWKKKFSLFWRSIEVRLGTW